LDPQVLPVRFIERDPQEIVDLDSLLEVTPVRAWRGEALLEEWKLGGRAVTARAVQEAVALSGDRGSILLTTHLNLDAATVDAVLLELGDTAEPRRPWTIRLAWTRPGVGLAADREIVARVHWSRGPQRIRLPLQGHPHWRGTISSVRFVLQTPQTVVRSVTLVRETVAASRLAALSRGFKADLGNEVRNALPALPGLLHERELRVPADARLRFSYGVRGRIYGTLRYRVTFSDTDGATQTLFEADLPPEEASAGWHEATVDLAGLAGVQGRLRLETSTGARVSLTQGLPLWGNPEVVASWRKPRPNVVLISIDTLRPDRLSLYGYDRSTTPNLDAWAATQASVFRSAVSQAPWTLPAHVSMLSGLDPFSHGVNHSSRTIPPSLVMLADSLRDAGYRTLAVTGGTLLHPRYGFSQGFDRYWYFAGNRSVGRELDEELKRALAWLDEAENSPFFLFFHTYEVHTPYRSREPYFSRFSDLPRVEDMRIEIPEPEASTGFLWEVDRSNLRLVEPDSLGNLDGPALVELASAAYDSGIAYVDEQLAKLFRKLRERGLEESTIVVLTSDHGEMLGEHGLVNHRYLYEENILVPLIIADPGGRGAGRVIPDQVRSVDIVPTILELAGLTPAGELDGRSLVHLLDGLPSALPEEAWTYAPETNYGVSIRLDNRLKYVYNDTAWPQIQGAEALYALAPTVNEDESLNDGPVRRRLRLRAQSAVARSPGLRVRFENDRDTTLTGSLAGGLIRFNTVKALDFPCSCLELEPFRLRFEVPPRASYTLILAGSSEDGMTVELATESGGETWRFEKHYPVTAFRQPMHIGLSESAWKEVDPGARTSASVRFWLEGPEAFADAAKPEEDPVLLDRLRALGYVE
jgi:arylsulfatase A-like enzyme